MRNLLILLSLGILVIMSSCKQVDKEQKQLSSKSKPYQKELHDLVNHKEGLHFVKLDTTTFTLLVKFDFEEREKSMKKINKFIEEKRIDSIRSLPVIEKDTIIQDTIQIQIDSIN